MYTGGSRGDSSNKNSNRPVSVFGNASKYGNSEPSGTFNLSDDALPKGHVV
jgi:hypothetical protein